MFLFSYWSVRYFVSCLLNFVWILLSSVPVHKRRYQFIKSIKYAGTREHQGLEALTGVPVQKAIRYFFTEWKIRTMRTIENYAMLLCVIKQKIYNPSDTNEVKSVPLTKDLKWNRLVKCFSSAGRLFHTRITRSEKKYLCIVVIYYGRLSGLWLRSLACVSESRCSSRHSLT